MTALLTTPTRDTHREWRPPQPARDRGPTLEDVVARAWEVLGTELPACCPVCGGELAPRLSASAGVVGGRCESCGSTLS